MKSLILYTTLMVAGVAYTQADTSTIFPPADVLLKQALEHIETGSKKVQELTGIETNFDKSKFENFLKTTYSKTHEKVSELINNLQNQAGSEQYKKTVESLVKQYDETVKQLNSPEVQGNVQKAQEVLSSSLKKIAEQTHEVGKSVGVTIPPSIQKTIGEIYDELKKSSQKVQDKVSKIVTETQAEIKKKASS